MNRRFAALESKLDSGLERMDRRFDALLGK